MPSVASSVLKEIGFPSICGQYLFKITREPIEIQINPESLVKAIDMYGPIICNLYIRKSQTQFLDRGPEINTQDPFFITHNMKDGVYNDIYSFPESKSSETRENIGHCVTIVGYGTVSGSGSRRFQVRNSFGESWGYKGDFNLLESHITPQTVHILLAIPFDSISVSKKK